ncbi:Gamma-aminobutyric acid type B receptor subunit 1 [Dissostichus eleginoides]|uniref:Gamma-aminobutyric acid type B receptor subunit 1 n=1 Tax=Dissostichus eleginoides TaxID=100907 RepID=A0AAD9EX14_DISEL|nr:Gamma-aminobutyric acid type B receptor subunit 1 [Dissostichus eleginoides]
MWRLSAGGIVQVLPVDYEIEYICRGNRVIVGPKVRKCLPNGTWTDLSQRSRCLLMCPRVWTSLENGRVSSWPLGPPVEGTVLHYSCLPSFILMGRNSTQCNKMGKWDTPKPVCHYDRHYKGDTLSSCLLRGQETRCPPVYSQAQGTRCPPVCPPVCPPLSSNRSSCLSSCLLPGSGATLFSYLLPGSGATLSTCLDSFSFIVTQQKE